MAAEQQTAQLALKVDELAELLRKTTEGELTRETSSPAAAAAGTTPSASSSGAWSGEPAEIEEDGGGARAMQRGQSSVGKVLSAMTPKKVAVCAPRLVDVARGHAAVPGAPSPPSRSLSFPARSVAAAQKVRAAFSFGRRMRGAWACNLNCICVGSSAANDADARPDAERGATAAHGRGRRAERPGAEHQAEPPQTRRCARGHRFHVRIPRRPHIARSSARVISLAYHRRAPQPRLPSNRPRPPKTRDRAPPRQVALTPHVPPTRAAPPALPHNPNSRR